ncbi:MAG: YihY/virulence factor BrkB family protein [Clostridia bacterium]|nr:YihY/virulence factor BrkB family protein [Clostridia bacterium]
MRKPKKVWLFLWGKYSLLSAKKYTTIAGTLVFFLIMSLVPMAFWAVLLVGKLPVDTQKMFSLPVFEGVSGVFDYIRREAQNATSGASVFLIVTTLYSATNLFYQMRKSGEIIYDFPHRKQGVKMRLGAVAVLFIVMALAVLTVLLFAIGAFFLSRIITGVWEWIADYLLRATLAFLLVLLLNIYICPYKVSPKCFLGGSLLTVLSWAVAIVGFAVYLKIGNLDRLYGALSALIVFLLWLYILMLCFVSGVIFNSERVFRSLKTR